VANTAADGIGRLLGVVGILVGGCAAAFFTSENQKLATRLANLENAHTTRKADADAFNKKWNEQLEQALGRFESLAKQTEQAEADARVQRQRDFDAKLAALAPPKYEDRELERLVKEKCDGLLATLTSPQLRVAERALKPADDNTLSVTLRNTGFEEAEITSVSFTPKEPFQTGPLATAVANSDEKYVIRFTKDDNVASGTGKHSTYNQEVIESRGIPPRGAVDVFVEIEDSAHVDWGWIGDLTIEYHERTIEIPNVRAVFVPGSEDSV
jgi:hypothetical protein